MEKSEQLPKRLSFPKINKVLLNKSFITGAVFLVLTSCNKEDDSKTPIDPISPPTSELTDPQAQEIKDDSNQQEAIERAKAQTLIDKLPRLYEEKKWTTAPDAMIFIFRELSDYYYENLTPQQILEIEKYIKKVQMAFAEGEFNPRNYELAELLKYQFHFSRFNTPEPPKLSKAEIALLYKNEILPALENKFNKYIPWDSALLGYKGLPKLSGTTEQREQVYFWMLRNNVEIDFAITELEKIKNKKGILNKLKQEIYYYQDLKPYIKLLRLFPFISDDISDEEVVKIYEKHQKMSEIAEAYDREDWTETTISWVPYGEISQTTVLELSIYHYKQTQDPEYLEPLVQVIEELKNGKKYPTNNYGSLNRILDRLNQEDLSDGNFLILKKLLGL